MGKKSRLVTCIKKSPGYIRETQPVNTKAKSLGGGKKVTLEGKGKENYFKKKTQSEGKGLLQVYPKKTELEVPNK